MKVSHSSLTYLQPWTSSAHQTHTSHIRTIWLETKLETCKLWFVTSLQSATSACVLQRCWQRCMISVPVTVCCCCVVIRWERGQGSAAQFYSTRPQNFMQVENTFIFFHFLLKSIVSIRVLCNYSFRYMMTQWQCLSVVPFQP